MILKYLKMFFADYLLLFFLGSIAGISATIFTSTPLAGYGIACACALLWYYIKYKKGKLTREHLRFNAVMLGLYLVLTLLLLVMTDGNFYDSAAGWIFTMIALPFAPMLLMSSLMMQMEMAAAAIAVCLLAVTMFCAVMWKDKKMWMIPVFTCMALAAGGLMVRNAPQYRYGGHGFNYMNGYSSTDFTGYHVYDGQKLASLDHPASFMIENESDMPVLDGAEACYPLYASLAKTLYRDIGSIEENYLKGSHLFNGKIVTFTNTVNGYYRLTDGNVDMFFGAGPSVEQQKYAKENGDEIVATPIGREAFVFFVEEDNPVDGLTSDQIRAIYHGDITNWKEVGGKDQKITAFQRPEQSGSQITMKYFMKDVTLKEPKTYEMVSPMEGIIHRVAEYANEKGAMGYTFRYFLVGLQQEKHVKVLSVDGVDPTPENIQNGTYPVCVNLVCATMKSNTKPEVQKVLDFLLSEDGQELVEKTGYARLPE